mgnify:CR=1 FL=1
MPRSVKPCLKRETLIVPSGFVLVSMRLWSLPFVKGKKYDDDDLMLKDDLGLSGNNLLSSNLLLGNLLSGNLLSSNLL